MFVPYKRKRYAPFASDNIPHGYDELCSKCGYRYGDHGVERDLCPEEFNYSPGYKPFLYPKVLNSNIKIL